MTKLEIYAFVVSVTAVIFGVHWLAGFEPNKSIEYLSKWGPFGDLLNPFITLATTCFAYLAFKNTREQLEEQKEQVRKERFSRIMQEFSSDLGLIIDGYLLKRGGHIYQGAHALKHYLDFLISIKNHLINNPAVSLSPNDARLSNAIHDEIVRVKHLIVFYASKIPLENQNLFPERVRLSLPFAIISSLSILAFIDSKRNDYELRNWLNDKNIRKYLIASTEDRFGAETHDY